MEKAKQLRFSLFFDKEKGIFTNEPLCDIGFRRLVEIYKSEFIKDITSKIKVADAQTKKELKKKLPFITPFGTFKPTRKNENITHFNSFLLCFDIDGLTEQEVQEAKNIISLNASTLLCAISPRNNGLKALILINDTIPLETCYNTLKFNKNTIAEHLNISQFIDKIDNAQFKPTQPFFIAYDEAIYINENCTPLDIQLQEYVKPVYFNEPIKTFEVDNHDFSEPIKYRTKAFLINAVNNLIKFFACCSEGNRHSQIIRVRIIHSWIKQYAPELEQEAKNNLLNACCRMYGSEKEARENNVYKSFEDAWNGAERQTNKTIETNIINDIKYNQNFVKNERA